jgi:hypothetical protein
MNIKSFKSSPLKFVPEEYFSGHVVGHGTFFSRFGKNKVFKLDLHGRVEDGILLIDETASYQDGHVAKTNYKFEKQSDNSYLISSPSFVKPVTGTIVGNALHWNYQYKHKSAEGETIVRFDDWMILHSDGIVLDRAFCSKWGVSLGEIVMSLKKQPGKSPK